MAFTTTFMNHHSIPGANFTERDRHRPPSVHNYRLFPATGTYELTPNNIHRRIVDPSDFRRSIRSALGKRSNEPFLFDIKTVLISTRTVPREKFKDCVNLTTVIFQPIRNKLMEELGVNLIKFEGKNSLEDKQSYSHIKKQIVKFAEPTTEVIGEGAFFNCQSLTSITLPNSLTTIERWAFMNCNSLPSITLPDSLTTIGGWAFHLCSSLRSITLPDSVTTIGDGTFRGCTSLRSITLPDSLTTIGDQAFAFCRSLESITLPDSLTTISEDAFVGCSWNLIANIYLRHPFLAAQWEISASARGWRRIFGIIGRWMGGTG